MLFCLLSFPFLFSLLYFTDSNTERIRSKILYLSSLLRSLCLCKEIVHEANWIVKLVSPPLTFIVSSHVWRQNPEGFPAFDLVTDRMVDIDRQTVLKTRSRREGQRDRCTLAAGWHTRYSGIYPYHTQPKSRRLRNISLPPYCGRRFYNLSILDLRKDHSVTDPTGAAWLYKVEVLKEWSNLQEEVCWIPKLAILSA